MNQFCTISEQVEYIYMHRQIFSIYRSIFIQYLTIYTIRFFMTRGILGLAVTITVIAAVVKRAVLQIYCKKTTRSRNNNKKMK